MEKRELSVPFISYLTIDIGWYYFMYTMLLIFTLKGVSSSNIGTLTFQVYPNSFKFLAAPFIDTYFIKKIGKRKTYLVLLSLLHSIMVFVLSFYINDWVENENIVGITIFGFIWNLTGIFKVSAHLAWGVTHFRPEIKGQGYSWMQFGSSLGAITAIPVFLFLNSDSFC
jgi:PAT family acetyl-CoA transporter-like MFS transporter 1